MGRRSSTFRTYSFTGHCFRHHVRKNKSAGISLGVTWILFVGIVFGHFNLNLDEHLLHFLKEFGLILFVYSVGLQVGPVSSQHSRRRIHTEPACHDGCIFRCDHHHYTPFHNRCPHYHNGRNSFGSCNQYPGTRCRTASKQ